MKKLRATSSKCLAHMFVQTSVLEAATRARYIVVGNGDKLASAGKCRLAHKTDPYKMKTRLFKKKLDTIRRWLTYDETRWRGKP